MKKFRPNNYSTETPPEFQSTPSSEDSIAEQMGSLSLVMEEAAENKKNQQQLMRMKEMMQAVINEPLKDIAKSFDRAIKIVVKSKDEELRAIYKKEMEEVKLPA